jgi:hypothetical protein
MNNHNNHDIIPIKQFESTVRAFDDYNSGFVA